MNDVIVM